MVMRALIISAIVLVAVVMGIGAISPMIPPAYASHGGPDPPQELCDALKAVFARSARIPVALEPLFEHC